MSPLTVHLIQAATRWHDPAGNRDDFESLMELLDDAELNALAQEREAGHFIDVDLNELG